MSSDATFRIDVDGDPAVDAGHAVDEAFELATQRPGERYRRLEQRIRDLYARRGEPLVMVGEPIDLGEGHLVVPASEEVSAILREARLLGLLR